MCLPFLRGNHISFSDIQHLDFTLVDTCQGSKKFKLTKVPCLTKTDMSKCDKKVWPVHLGNINTAWDSNRSGTLEYELLWLTSNHPHYLSHKYWAFAYSSCTPQCHLGIAKHESHPVFMLLAQMRWTWEHPSQQILHHYSHMLPWETPKGMVLSVGPTYCYHLEGNIPGAELLSPATSLSFLQTP